MDVEIVAEAEAELAQLRRRSLDEYVAMFAAIAKLEAVGVDLPFPHSSHVKGTNLRELRPRRGRSPWRAFYCRVGNVMRIGAIGPEANHNPRGFRAAVRLAIARLGLG